jgi:hypothetical protein
MLQYDASLLRNVDLQHITYYENYINFLTALFFNVENVASRWLLPPIRPARLTDHQNSGNRLGHHRLGGPGWVGQVSSI